MTVQALRNAVAGVVAAGVVTVASAQATSGIDLGEATGKLADAAVSIGTLGLAVLGIAVGIKLFKWLRAAL